MNRSTPILFGILASIAYAGSMAAQSVVRTEVAELKPLLTRAIVDGSAYGVLVGTTATYISQRFGAQTPIEIDVRTLHALPQPGCSRLEVTTRQRDVLEQDKRTDKALTYQVSFCRDGRFPEKP